MISQTLSLIFSIAKKSPPTVPLNPLQPNLIDFPPHWVLYNDGKLRATADQWSAQGIISCGRREFIRINIMHTLVGVPRHSENNCLWRFAQKPEGFLCKRWVKGGVMIRAVKICQKFPIAKEKFGEGQEVCAKNSSQQVWQIFVWGWSGSAFFGRSLWPAFVVKMRWSK